MRLSAAIMHAPWVPARAQIVAQLRLRLRGIGSVTVVCDVERQGLWPTAQRAWLAHPPDATHHLVLQDDVELCAGFVPHVQAGLVVKPQAAIGYAHSALYLAKAVRRHGGHWLPLHGMTAGQAVCLPVPMIRPWLAWCQRRVAPEYLNDDVRLALFLLSRDVPMWWTVPSLALHVGADESLLGHTFGSGHRLLYDPQPGEVDWRAGADLLARRLLTFDGLARRNKVRLLES